MSRRISLAAAVMFAAGMLLLAAVAWSQAVKPKSGCAGLPDHARLRAAVQAVMKLGKDKTTGLGNARWAAVVNRDGLVCSVAFSGENRGDQWPGSRAIAAEKANTANALSAPAFALATGNLFAATQPGQSLYGLVATAPPNGDAAYSGDPSRFGQADDPLVGKMIGGIVVFGGGLALYDNTGQLLGGLGVSGDTACSDHVVAWKMRHALNLDGVPAGVAPNATDNLIFDIQNGASPSGYGHPHCVGGKPSEEVIKGLPDSDPIGHKR
ncbi:MAG TPA: heme-binding protein [Polyangiales bacterium]|nr:heme-binding protein [Polyangiales bacterium]